MCGLDSVQNDVTDNIDAVMSAQSINKCSVTWCQVRLGQFAKHLDSVHDDFTDTSDALEAAKA